MIYYVFLAIVDIFIYLTENWKEFTFITAASAIGMILGKRIGTRIALNYALKMMGISQKTSLEYKVDWLMSQEESRGNLWTAPTSNPYKVNIQMSLSKLFILLRMGRYFARFTKLRTNLRRKKKMSISRKLLMAIFGAVILVLNQQLGWSLDPDSIIGTGSLIISFILGQSIVDMNGYGQFAPLLEKLKSKKLWAAVVGSIIIVLNDTFKWGMDANSIYILAATGVSFILGKSAISVVKAAGGSDVKPTIDGSSDK